ncbi:MAG: hypothetical protein WD361_06005 [Gracilimonas sp.]
MMVSPGCKNWHSLQIDTENQPVQFGPHLTTSMFDSLGSVTGYTKYDFVEGSGSETENLYIGFSDREFFEENLNETIYSALNDHPNHFIADGRAVVEVKYGVSFGQVIAAIFTNLIAGPNSETEIGTYSEEHIYYNGMVYKINENADYHE